MRIRFAVLMFLTIFALCGMSALAQSRDRESPTPISGTIYRGSVRDYNRDGSAAYYFSINVEPGTVNTSLNYSSPPGGATMSVFFSGIDCCPAGSELGDGDESSESTFTVRNRQTLLVEVYVDTEFDRSINFTLEFGGSVGGPGGTTICTDLSILIAKSQSTKVGTKQIRVDIFGAVKNDSTGDFVSGEGQQSLKIYETSPRRAGASVVFTQPFTGVRGGGQVPFVFSKTYSLADFTRLSPSFRVQIVYDSAIGSDGNVRNDDCVATNNTKAIPYELIKAPR